LSSEIFLNIVVEKILQNARKPAILRKYTN